MESEVLAIRGEDGVIGVILARNPFYLESGGQVSDVGTVEGDGWVMEVMGSSFQVWSLPDLTLLATVRLPEGPLGHEHLDPAEVRLLSDSTTAILTTFTCSMYLLRDLDSDEPWAELVHTFPWDGYEAGDCAIPATRGRWWVQTWTHASGSALVSLDMSDPSAPIVVDELTMEERWWPHWISMEPEGDRIVVTSSPGSTLYRVLMARLDPETGDLAWDATFRDPGSGDLGVSFNRDSWPHGSAGPALPHGTVFSRPGR